MSDNLRDRIAAVIAQHAVCMCGEWAENMTEQAQHQADAVIEALGMQVGAIADVAVMNYLFSVYQERGNR